MRWPRIVGCFWVSLLSAPATAEPAAIHVQSEGNTATPLAMVRTLQLLQDKIVAGSTSAHLAQRALLAHIDEHLIDLDLKVWKDQKNIRAAVIFVLSGGKPEILKKLLSFGSLVQQDERLVQGALAYVEGREADAARYLSEVDVRALPPGLAAQISLVQSALVVRNDPARSVELLDSVRLLVPGTLLEEAALRREIFVAGQIGNIKKFETLSMQYLHRFRHSIYSGNFRQRFAFALTRPNFAKNPELFSRLVSMLNALEPDGRRELYLLVARAAIDEGQTEAAILASDKAYELSTADKVSAERSRLYRAAAAIVTVDGFEAALAKLRGIDRGNLPANDIALLDAALSTAKQIRDAPENSPKTGLVAQAAPPPAEKTEQAIPPLPAISRAQDAINRVDQLFQKEIR